MAAGYELTQLRPGMGEIRTVHKAVRPVLEFIFEEGFPHNISKVTTFIARKLILFCSQMVSPNNDHLCRLLLTISLMYLYQK